MTSSVGKPERQARPKEQARQRLLAREPEGCVRRVRGRASSDKKTGQRPAALSFKVTVGEATWLPHVRSIETVLFYGPLDFQR
ncbi:hypothetical protein ACFX2I_039966 [Malus domestica]